MDALRASTAVLRKFSRIIAAMLASIKPTAQQGGTPQKKKSRRTAAEGFNYCSFNLPLAKIVCRLLRKSCL
jgi:hypothetical protein